MNRVKKTLASLGVATALVGGTVAVDVATPSTASAAANQQVCNNSSSGGSVRTISTAGTKLNLSPGRCSLTNVFGWRPLAGTFALAVDATGRTFTARYQGETVYSWTHQGPIRVIGVYRD